MEDHDQIKETEMVEVYAPSGSVESGFPEGGDLEQKPSRKSDSEGSAGSSKAKGSSKGSKSGKSRDDNEDLEEDDPRLTEEIEDEGEDGKLADDLDLELENLDSESRWNVLEQRRRRNIDMKAQGSVSQE